jgi:hypothetical protein
MIRKVAIVTEQWKQGQKKTCLCCYIYLQLSFVKYRDIYGNVCLIFNLPELKTYQVLTAEDFEVVWLEF